MSRYSRPSEYLHSLGNISHNEEVMRQIPERVLETQRQIVDTQSKLDQHERLNAHLMSQYTSHLKRPDTMHNDDKLHDLIIQHNDHFKARDEIKEKLNILHEKFAHLNAQMQEPEYHSKIRALNESMSRIHLTKNPQTLVGEKQLAENIWKHVCPHALHVLNDTTGLSVTSIVDESKWKSVEVKVETWSTVDPKPFDTRWSTQNRIPVYILMQSAFPIDMEMSVHTDTKTHGVPSMALYWVAGVFDGKEEVRRYRSLDLSGKLTE